MKVELLVNDIVVAEFNGSVSELLRFQATTFQCMADAQQEHEDTRKKRSREMFERLNALQLGTPRTAPTDHQQGDPES